MKQTLMLGDKTEMFGMSSSAALERSTSDSWPAGAEHARSAPPSPTIHLRISMSPCGERKVQPSARTFGSPAFSTLVRTYRVPNARASDQRLPKVTMLPTVGSLGASTRLAALAD